MLCYIRHQNYAIAIESDTEITSSTVFLTVKKVYQLMMIPSNVVGIDGSRGMKDVKMLKFDYTDPKTYNTPESNGKFWLNIKDALEISELKDWPKMEDITPAELQKIQAELMKAQQMKNKKY